MSKYKKTYPKMLVEHMKQGYTFDSFGASPVCVTKKTLNNWVTDHKEFAEAKEKGTLECQKFWEKIGIKGVIGGFKGFSAAAYIFNMKNRFKWSDRTDLVVSSDEHVKDKEKHETLKNIDRKKLITMAKAG